MGDFVKFDVRNYPKVRLLDEFMANHNGYVAGGVFKCLLSGERFKDVDIFFRSASDFEEAQKTFESNEGVYRKTYQNEKACGFVHIARGVKIDLVRSIFGEVEELLEQFDFTVTKFAYHKVEIYDGSELVGVTYELIGHTQFFEHLFNKRLVCDKNIPFPVSTMNRAFRYARYGFTPCTETKMKIVREIRENNSEDDINMELYAGFD